MLFGVNAFLELLGFKGPQQDEPSLDEEIANLQVKDEVWGFEKSDEAPFFRGTIIQVEHEKGGALVLLGDGTTTKPIALAWITCVEKGAEE